MANLTQLMAAGALIVRLERICSLGVLSLEQEIETRQIIVDAAKAFQFHSLAERPLSNVVNIETAAQALVRKEMAL